MNDDRDAKAVDFLWLLLPHAVLASFCNGAEPAGLVNDPGEERQEPWSRGS